ncbi:hypothetical protein HOLleu_16898 [Holothuria leucospilota]|uniref:Uncharacterized protein n=1 Tax=Holothuria leucospilota TaxID=206669 RepID=A0A9Q1C6U4_HOLLE|nr:hypothetical protein HOLleu_16898 [Holothuria leucospilota]
MANVFTRRLKKPRTTTLSDFCGRPAQPFEGTQLRALSPTRRQNPHSIGLIYQSPYNKDNQTFGIWSPDFHRISARLPDMYKHIVLTNWTCKHALHGKTKIEPRTTPPVSNFTLDSTSRLSYRQPKQAFPALEDQTQKTTRFGHTPYKAVARGIVVELPFIRQAFNRELSRI